MNPVWSGIRRSFQEMVNFLYPPSCVWCGGLQKKLTTLAFCQNCRERVAPTRPYRCRVCSAPVGPHLNTEQGCLDCRPGIRRYQAAVSLGTYEGELRQFCLRCKHSARPLAVAGARLLFLKEQERLRGWNVDLVLPVPHHWIDRIRFGESVSSTLADEFSRLLNVPTDRHLLVKRRRTEPQHGKTAAQRRNSLRGAFSVHPRARIAGLRILLTDDILTSGTTASRSAQVLMEAGASEVYVAVLARTILSGQKGIS